MPSIDVITVIVLGILLVITAMVLDKVQIAIRVMVMALNPAILVRVVDTLDMAIMRADVILALALGLSVVNHAVVQASLNVLSVMAVDKESVSIVLGLE